MKIPKIIYMIILIGIVLFGCLYVWQAVNYQKAKDEWEQQKKELQMKIGITETLMLLEVEEAKKWKEKADDTAEEVTRLEEALEEKELAHARDLEKIAELTPDELVENIRYYLKVDVSEVWLTQQGIVFSVDAGREAVRQFKSLDFHFVEKVPDLEAALAKSKKSAKEYEASAVKWEKAYNEALEGIEYWKCMYKGEYNLRLKAEKKFKLFSVETGVSTVIGVGLGLLLGR
jgi:hypothetical protein